MLMNRVKGPLASYVAVPESSAQLCNQSAEHSHLRPANAGSSLAGDVEHRKRLEKRLQAQLKDGSRSRIVKRLSDPLVKHLLRVAGNAPYRLAGRQVRVCVRDVYTGEAQGLKLHICGTIPVSCMCFV